MTNLDYLYNADAVKNFFGKNYFSNKKLGIKIVERGTIVPFVPVFEKGQRVLEFGGVVDGNGKFIDSSVGKFNSRDTYTPTEKIPFVPATVVYLGLFYPVWGHCLTDNIRYHWFLHSDVFKKYFADCPLIYIPWHGGGAALIEHQKNFRRLLEILEVDVDKLQPIDQPMQFENVIVPDESFFVRDTEFFTDEYREMIDRVRNFALKNRTPSASKKIYIFYGTNQFGEERLAEYFRSKSYEIVLPEKLTFDEQLNVLINAESFASTLGSCSHNSIFLRDGTEVILIPRAANYFTYYQNALDQVHDLNTHYINSSLSIFKSGRGPYCFILSRQLKKFFGDEFNGYSDDDLKIFLAYVRACMARGLKQNIEAMKYYGATLQEFLSQLKQREDLLKAYGIKLQ